MNFPIWLCLVFSISFFAFLIKTSNMFSFFHRHMKINFFVLSKNSNWTSFFSSFQFFFIRKWIQTNHFTIVPVPEFKEEFHKIQKIIIKKVKRIIYSIYNTLFYCKHRALLIKIKCFSIFSELVYHSTIHPHPSCILNLQMHSLSLQLRLFNWDWIWCMHLEIRRKII